MPSFNIIPSSQFCQFSATIWMPLRQKAAGSRFDELIRNPDGYARIRNVLLCLKSPAPSLSCTSMTPFSDSEKMCVGMAASGCVRLLNDTPRV